MPKICDCEESNGAGPRGDSICPICRENLEPSTKTFTHTRCRTLFYRECLYTWVIQQEKGDFAICPIDRDIIGFGEREESDDGSEENFDLSYLFAEPMVRRISRKRKMRMRTAPTGLVAKSKNLEINSVGDEEPRICQTAGPSHSCSRHELSEQAA